MLNPDRIEQVILAFHDAFLVAPLLQLTPQEARRRFQIDEASSRAVLGLLDRAGLLCRSENGGYVRLFPTLMGLPRRGKVPVDSRSAPAKIGAA